MHRRYTTSKACFKAFIAGLKCFSRIQKANIVKHILNWKIQDFINYWTIGLLFFFWTQLNAISHCFKNENVTQFTALNLFKLGNYDFAYVVHISRQKVKIQQKKKKKKKKKATRCTYFWLPYRMSDWCDPKTQGIYHPPQWIPEYFLFSYPGVKEKKRKNKNKTKKKQNKTKQNTKTKQNKTKKKKTKNQKTTTTKKNK